MKDSSRNAVLYAGFILAMLILSSISLLADQNMRRMIESDKWATHLYDVILKLDDLLSELKDAETGERGYSITGDENYLQPYNEAVKNIGLHIRELKTSVSDHPILLSRLDTIEQLVTIKLSELKLKIELRKTKSFEAASKVMLTNEGKITMDKIRKQVAESRREETANLEQRKNSKERSTHALDVVLALGGFFGFLLLAIIFLQLKKEIKKRIAIENELRIHQDHLNDLVEKRTFELKASEQRWATTLASIGEGIIATDEAGRIVFMNAVAENLTGWTFRDAREEYLNKVFTIAKVENQQSIEGLVATVLTKGTNIDYGDNSILIGKSGKETRIEMNGSPIRTDTTMLGGVVIIFQDVSGRKKQEEIRSRLAAIVEHSDDAILSKTLDGTITSWNRGAQILYGYTENEVIGQSVFLLTPPGHIDEMQQILQKIRKGNLVRAFDAIRKRKDGSLVHVSLTVSPMKDSAGSILGASTIAHDISDHKRLEADLKQRADDLASVNKELESFSYSVAHDLRSPLSAILGFCDYLTEEYSEKLDEDGKTSLFYIKKSGEKMKMLISDLLRLSKITQQEITYQNIDISKLALSIIDDLKQSNPDRKVDIYIAQGLQVNADEALFKLALENIIANAWKFTSKTSHPYIEVGSITKNGSRVFYVKDNGAGFEMKHAEKLFAPFKRLHSDKEFVGTGIGLAIVERVIKRHGGSVWAEGEANNGATFYFTIGNVI